MPLLPERPAADEILDRSFPTYPHWLPDPQTYAIDQERSRHDQALYSFGEYSMFVLFWTIFDFEAGVVGRCPTCYGAYGDIAEAYGQGAKERCPDCFGSTFEGGYKAKIVRPALWDSGPDNQRQEQRGNVIVETAAVQSTSDFKMTNGDFIFRADGTRWQMRTYSFNRLRTGFLSPNSADTTIGLNYGTVGREDESSVAYMIPPASATALREILDVVGTQRPIDFTDVEEFRDGAVLI